MTPSPRFLNAILGRSARLTRATSVQGISEVVEGRVIAYSESPVYLIESEDGHRRIVGADCSITLLDQDGSETPVYPRESDVYSSTERATGWDHDQREPIGFRAGGGR